LDKKGKTNDHNFDEFLVEYNEMLSKAALEHNGSFAALASPTLNKQETISFLYKNILSYVNAKHKKAINYNLPLMYIEFIPRLVLIFTNLLVTMLLFRVKSIPTNCIYFRTWLVPKSISNGAVRDEYFNNLIKDISIDNDVVVAYQPLSYGKLLRQFKRSDQQNNYIVPIGLLNIMTLVKLFYNYIINAKVTLKKRYQFKGVDITKLINNSLKKDFFKLRSFQAYLELSIAKRVVRFKPKLLFYVFENQAWENAYLKELKNSNTKIIGYQSSGFSYRFLNFFPTKIDKEHSLFPDRIITVGKTFTNLLKDLGHYPIPIDTFAALRFNYPTHKGDYIIENANQKLHGRILYAFSVHWYQYEAIIKDLINIFKESEIEISLQFHPLYNNKNYKFVLPGNFTRVFSTKVGHLKNKYDLVLFNDNSFGIESLMMGVKSYEYNFGEIYPENRLPGFTLYDYRLDFNGLTAIRDSILNRTYSKDLERNYINKYIRKMYEVYDSELINVFK